MTTATSKFVGLHNHTDNSFLDGLQRSLVLAKRAHSLGHSAVAINDHQEVGGHLMFQKACQEVGIKPIFGMEGYLVDSVHQARENKIKVSEISHITLLAQNQTGLRNLWAWSSQAYIDNFYHRALSDWDFASNYAEGIYASDGCLLSYMAMAIIDDDENRCHELMGRYLNTFGENFYMELHTFQILNPSTEKHHELNQQMTKVNQAKVALARQYGVPLVVVNDAHYAEESDWEDHATIWQISTGGGKKANSDQTEHGRAASWVMADHELYHYMGNHGISPEITAEAIRNTSIIAANCNVEIKSEVKMPRLTGSERDDLKMFIDHVEAGFERKIVKAGLDVELYWPRAEMEVRTIVAKRFPGYFNVVANYTKDAKVEKKMLVGPGRGSGGGSLVAYLMDITEVDAVKYDLLFERFISPDRKGFPDIDIDFPQSRRGEVKEYLGGLFGHDCVCSIGTRMKMQPRSAITDIARVSDIPFNDSRSMADLVETISDMEHEEGSDETWEDVIGRVGGELVPWMQKYPSLFDKVERLVGMTRQAGTHPAGVLVSNRPLTGDLPLRMRDGVITTQFDMNEVEELGYVKFDILGLRHLDTLQHAKDLIIERHDKEIDFYSFGDMEYGDPAIWPAVHAGGTLGLFQLESPGGTSDTMKFRPWNEVEMAALISINRPGVKDAQLDEVFLDRRHGREAVVYDHPLMEKYVKKTYGILVYQEQILKAVQGIAGFTPDEADTLRGILGKKKAHLLPPFHQLFIEGCMGNPEFTGQCTDPMHAIETIWNSIQASGRYSFNEAHAIAYGMIPCWEAWLKHYYYPEFVTALLRTDPKKVKRYAQEARSRGLQVLPPDINTSQGSYTLVSDKVVRFGLGSVSHVGQGAVDEILEHAPFEGVTDMVNRVSGKKVNIRVIANLIRVGAFDTLGPRGQQLDELSAVKKVKEPLEVPDFDNVQVLTEIEETLLGTWVTHDPLGKWAQMIEDKCATSAEFQLIQNHEVLLVGGQITEVTTTMTKREKKPMGFVTIGYNDSTYRLVVFPEAWAKNRMYLKMGAPVICRVSGLDNGAQLVTTQRLDYLDN